MEGNPYKQAIWLSWGGGGGGVWSHGGRFKITYELFDSSDRKNATRLYTTSSNQTCSK